MTKSKRESLDDALFAKFKDLYKSKKGKQKPLLEKDEYFTKKNYSGEASPIADHLNKKTYSGEGMGSPLAADPDRASVSPWADADISTQSLYEEVVEAIDELSARERQVLALLAEDKSQVEVSSILQISPKTVNTLLKRARTKVRNHLRKL